MTARAWLDVRWPAADRAGGRVGEDCSICSVCRFHSKPHAHGVGQETTFVARSELAPGASSAQISQVDEESEKVIPITLGFLAKEPRGLVMVREFLPDCGIPSFANSSFIVLVKAALLALGEVRTASLTKSSTCVWATCFGVDF